MIWVQHFDLVAFAPWLENARSWDLRSNGESVNKSGGGYGFGLAAASFARRFARIQKPATLCTDMSMPYLAFISLAIGAQVLPAERSASTPSASGRSGAGVFQQGKIDSIGERVALTPYTEHTAKV